VGVAVNKFLAKVASDLRKPDGLVVVPPGAEAGFLAPLPIGRLWGVGRVTEHALGTMGIRTIGQLAQVPADRLAARLGASGAALRALARGEDARPVEPFAPPKSMGAEETFDADHRDLALLHATLRAQAERIARELRSEGYAARVVTLKIRFADFSTHTRAHSTEPTQDGLAIYREARALLERLRLSQPVRLIGIAASGLGPAARGQLSLLAPDAVRRERLAGALDRLQARFGEEAVRPASLVAPPGAPGKGAQRRGMEPPGGQGR
jgi:DNA polymerase-4